MPLMLSLVSTPMQCALPTQSLLHKYPAHEAVVDCYQLTVSDSYSHQQFISAFYSSWLFNIERFILRLVVNKPSSPQQLQHLVCGTGDKFAVWHVEQRSDNQLLLCDDFGHTRSWLMIEAGLDSDLQPITTLYFGSAVIIKKYPVNNKYPLSFRLLGRFHHWYSIALLRAGKNRMLKLG